jgi:hypothetical protein
MLIASCHCGSIQIEVARKPSVLRRCTCSICRRYAALWAYCSRKTARVSSARGALRAYLWGHRAIEFYHCGTCGCLTHYESGKQAKDSRIAVNCRMLSPDAIEGIRIRTFDGADTWKYLD